MFGSANNGANAYAKVGVETGVIAATPHKLITMLFDGALIAITTARQHMVSGHIADKGKSISKAIMIIDGGLRASLNKDVGGEIAKNLDTLYEYMSNRLVLANLKNQPEILDEVAGLLRDLKNSWEAIDTSAAQAAETAQAQPAPPLPKASPYDAVAPQPSRLMKA